MTRRTPVNVAASVRQRLHDRARREGVQFQLLLEHFAIERLLYRLQASRHAGRFILKGAMLFRVWEGRTPRQTRDLDLLGQGEPDEMATLFTEVAGTHITPDDGVIFDASSVRSEPIRDHTEYRGVRVRMHAHLDSARIPVQVDVGFGDAVTPDATPAAYPGLLDFPTPTIRMYPRETVVAEKFQAIVSLSTANTRVKDYFDLWHLGRHYAFDGTDLHRALRTTFERRETALPKAAPAGLGAAYLGDVGRVRQWEAFVERSTEGREAPSFVEAGSAIKGFLLPAVTEGFSAQWTPGGPWQDKY
ncbi:MAG TPA: nucleotidyl transferase AbiEii/AbiGii toxin family protein [Gemmatimonadales bacterium]